MGVGKTERLGINTSRFGKGRRVDEANERILRKLKVKGGRIHKAGDSWVIEVSELTPAGSVGSSSGVGIGQAGTDGTDGTNSGDRCADCCNYDAGCPEPEKSTCAHTTNPDGSSLFSTLSGGLPAHFGLAHPGPRPDGEDHEDGSHPGKTGPCW